MFQLCREAHYSRGEKKKGYSFRHVIQRYPKPTTKVMPDFTFEGLIIHLYCDSISRSIYKTL